MADAAEQESRALEREIEGTRVRMGNALEEIGARLSPDRLKEQAKSTLHDATIGRVQTMARDTVDRAKSAGRRATDIVRENPIPAAMVGLGLGWLVWNVFANGRTANDNAGSADSYGTDPGLDDRARDATQSVAETGRNAAHRVADRAGHLASSAADTAAAVGSRVSRTTRAQSDRLEQVFNESPLIMGSAALAIGVAAGLLIPETRKESELVGEQRDKLVGRARKVIADKSEQVEHVAERVITEAKSVAAQAARDEGLTRE